MTWRLPPSQPTAATPFVAKEASPDCERHWLMYQSSLGASGTAGSRNTARNPTLAASKLHFAVCWLHSHAGSPLLGADTPLAASGLHASNLSTASLADGRGLFPHGPAKPSGLTCFDSDWLCLSHVPTSQPVPTAGRCLCLIGWDQVTCPCLGGGLGRSQPLRAQTEGGGEGV